MAIKLTAQDPPVAKNKGEYLEEWRDVARRVTREPGVWFHTDRPIQGVGATAIRAMLDELGVETRTTRTRVEGAGRTERQFRQDTYVRYVPADPAVVVAAAARLEGPPRLTALPTGPVLGCDDCLSMYDHVDELARHIRIEHHRDGPSRTERTPLKAAEAKARLSHAV